MTDDVHVDYYTTPRPITEYHEDMGPMLWWNFPIEEQPYVGTPNDLGRTVEAHTRIITQVNQITKPVISRINVGGWPGYHTHFTPIPIPTVPKP